MLADTAVAVVPSCADPPSKRLQLPQQRAGRRQAPRQLEPASLKGGHQRPHKRSLWHPPHIAVEGDVPAAGAGWAHPPWGLGDPWVVPRRQVLIALPSAFNGRETASYGQTPIAAQSTRAQHLAG